MNVSMHQQLRHPYISGERCVATEFTDTMKGAKASATLYSLVSTARANGLEPYTYLQQLFAELPKAKRLEDFEAPLPFSNPTSESVNA